MTQDVIDAEIIDEPRRNNRRGDGGIYLVVAEDTDEFRVALRYAARRAQTHRAHVGILHVMTIDEFQHWGNVEAMMRHELRQQAEKYIWSLAKDVYELNGMTPVLYIKEGNRQDALIETVNEDTMIRVVMLGAGTASSGPGPLVSYFTGKGLSRMRVPVLVVPGHLDPQKVDTIAL